jgi:hypothetical protein
LKAAACFLALLLGAQDKKAVPDDAALKEAEKTVRDLFKDEFAKKTPADKRALAKRLLVQGRESKNTPATQYALLVLANDLGIQTLDLDTCVMAMTELSTHFAIDVVAQRNSSLAALSKGTKSSEDLKALAKAYLALSDEAIKIDRYDDATKAAEAAGAQAKRAKELTLVSAAEGKSKEVAARKLRFEKVEKAKETLAAAPEDPAANLEVGTYFCFVKGDWGAGLPFLGKSPDPILKNLALLDAGNPPSAGDQVLVGDGWWDRAQAAPAEERILLDDRAGSWYQQALAKLEGKEKDRVQQRLFQLSGERLGRGNWVELSDPAFFGEKGKFGDPIEITVPKTGRGILSNSKAFPPGEYDAWQIRVRFKDKDQGNCSLCWEGPGYGRLMSIAMNLGEKELITAGPKFPQGLAYVGPLPLLDEYLVTVVIGRGVDIAYINGREVPLDKSGRSSRPAHAIDFVRHPPVRQDPDPETLMKILILLVLLRLQEKAPEAPALLDAEKTVRALYKDDYSKKTPKERAFLGQKLLDQARQSKDAPASQFVLYRESQDNFAQGGELTLCLDAIDEWSRRFQIDAVDTKVKAIATAAKLAKTPEEGLPIAVAHLKVADAAALADRFDIAEKETQAAQATARKAANVPLLNRATARSKDLADQKAVYDKLKKSRDSLEANPEDAEASLAVGKYQCFVKGHWEAGLPLLAKGSEATLKELAKKDLAAPKEPELQLEIGDGWWELAEKSTGASKILTRARAVAWYDQAIPKLQGLPKVKADQRATVYYTSELFQGSWVEVDSKYLAGKAGETEPPPSGFWYKAMNQVPPGSEYDAVSLRIRATGKEPGNISVQLQIIPREKVFFDQVGKTLVNTVKEGGGARTEKKATFEPKDEYILTLVLVDGTVVVYLDGREKFRYETEVRLVKFMSFYRVTGSYSVDQVKLRKKV